MKTAQEWTQELVHQTVETWLNSLPFILADMQELELNLRTLQDLVTNLTQTNSEYRASLLWIHNETDMAL